MTFYDIMLYTHREVAMWPQLPMTDPLHTGARYDHVSMVGYAFRGSLLLRGNTHRSDLRSWQRTRSDHS